MVGASSSHGLPSCPNLLPVPKSYEGQRRSGTQIVSDTSQTVSGRVVRLAVFRIGGLVERTVSCEDE
jgi:hypothetical protein